MTADEPGHVSHILVISQSMRLCTVKKKIRYVAFSTFQHIAVDITYINQVELGHASHILVISHQCASAWLKKKMIGCFFDISACCY